MKKPLSLLLTLCIGLFVGGTLTACGDDSESVAGGNSSVNSSVDSSVDSSETSDDSSVSSSDSSTTERHQHEFAAEWSKNEAEHWHACLGTDCTDVSDKATHTYGAWTDAGNGQHEKTCVCGQTVVEKCEWNAGVVTTEATCEEQGVKTFTCTKCSTTKTENFDELGHAYSVTFVWTGVTAQANVVCQNDAKHNTTVAATVTSAATNPTCTVDGETVYTATATFAGKTYEDTKTVTHENTATGHDYVLSAWQWTEYSEAEAQFVCSRDETHTKEVTAEISSTTTNPTCTVDGETVYTATATLNGQNYTDTKKQTLDKKTHDYDFVGFEWADDLTSAKAKLVCQNDETHIQRQTLEVVDTYHQPTCTENGYTVYSIIFRYDEITHEDSKTVTHENTALGHRYDNRGWSWAEDYASATLSLYCPYCRQSLTPAGTVTSETTNPTCSQAGSTVYTASVTVNGTDYTDTETVILPASHNIVNGVCALCGYRESVGLEYAETDDGYKLMSRGTCTDTEIYIPEVYQGQPVVEIAMNAFLNQTDITLIKVPSSVTLINGSAFAGCSALKELTLPFVGRSASDSTYYYIGYIFGAISYESTNYTPASLQKLIITGGTVRSNALYSCNNVKEIHILEGATATMGSQSSPVKYGALRNCTSVERLTLPEGYSTTASFYLGAYFGGTYTNWVTVPSTLKSLSIRGGQYANLYNFQSNCSTVSELVIGSGITHAGITTENVKHLYYEGTAEEYSALINKPYNYYGTTTVYYYSEEEPTEEGNFWRWAADGVTPIPWAMSGTWTLVSLTTENPSTEIIPGENGTPLNYVVIDLKADGTFLQTINSTTPSTVEGTWVFSNVYGSNKITLTPANPSNGGALDFWLNSDGTMSCSTVISSGSQTIVLRKIELLGEYTLVSQTISDGVESDTSIAGVDIPNMYVELKADGTFTQEVIAVGETEPLYTKSGTWTKVGNTVSLTADSDTISGTYYGETITLSYAFGDTMTITDVYKKM